MTIKKQVILTIYDTLLQAEYSALTIINNLDYEDLTTTADELSSLEGNIEAISAILSNINTLEQRPKDTTGS